jgi:undecaprenyl pyrophosphate phosphatase UppP
MQVLSLITTNESTNIDIIPLAFGVLSASVCGYVAINSMLKVIKKANYKWFSLYLVLISIINLITCF